MQPGFNATTLSGDGIRKRGNRNEKLESLCPTTVIAKQRLTLEVGIGKWCW